MLIMYDLEVIWGEKKSTGIYSRRTKLLQSQRVHKSCELFAGDCLLNSGTFELQCVK